MLRNDPLKKSESVVLFQKCIRILSYLKKHSLNFSLSTLNLQLLTPHSPLFTFHSPTEE